MVARKDRSLEIVDRFLAAPRLALQPLPRVVEAAEPNPVELTGEERVNAAIGCRTSRGRAGDPFAGRGDPTPRNSDDTTTTATATDGVVDEWLASATAMLGELEPATATEAMLAALMIGTQKAALSFLQRAGLAQQTFEGTNANVLRATRLMRMFNEQIETMSKLKGKGTSQQRVVVEHVTVAAGGQAIVGVANALPRGEGVGGFKEVPQALPWTAARLARNGNPTGDFLTAPRCGARTRRQT